MFSSEAPCEIMRMLMPSSELKTRRGDAGREADILAHQAYDGLVLLHFDLGELAQFAEDGVDVLRLSMVRETLTSDVATMSTGVS